MVFVGWIILDHGNHRVRTHETCQIIDMSVSVVSLDPVSQPQDMRYPEIGPQVLFDRRLVQMRVAVRVQEARLCGEQRSPAVDVDRAAFHDDPRAEHGQAEFPGDQGWDRVVEIIRWVFAAPRVEVPIHDGLWLIARLALNEDRPMVTAPGVVRRVVVEEYVPTAGTFIREKPADIV